MRGGTKRASLGESVAWYSLARIRQTLKRKPSALDDAHKGERECICCAKTLRTLNFQSVAPPPSLPPPPTFLPLPHSFSLPLTTSQTPHPHRPLLQSPHLLRQVVRPLVAVVVLDASLPPRRLATTPGKNNLSVDLDAGA